MSSHSYFQLSYSFYNSRLHDDILAIPHWRSTMDLGARFWWYHWSWPVCSIPKVVHSGEASHWRNCTSCFCGYSVSFVFERQTNQFRTLQELSNKMVLRDGGHHSIATAGKECIQRQSLEVLRNQCGWHIDGQDSFARTHPLVSDRGE